MYLRFEITESEGIHLISVNIEMLPKNFPEWSYQFILPPAEYESSSCSIFLTTLDLINLFVLAILVAGLWYYAVVLISIYLISRHVEHLFVCLMAIWLSFIKYFYFFFLLCFLISYYFVGILYILRIWLNFCFLLGSFSEKQFLIIVSLVYRLFLLLISTFCILWK